MLPGYPAGVAATSPPHPTLGWATTQVYPARICFVHEWKLDGEAAISATITLAAVGGTGAPKPRLHR